jgi:hypothetical protein
MAFAQRGLTSRKRSVKIKTREMIELMRRLVEKPDSVSTPDIIYSAIKSISLNILLIDREELTVQYLCLQNG